jgi:hypothetical protein
MPAVLAPLYRDPLLAGIEDVNQAGTVMGILEIDLENALLLNLPGAVTPALPDERRREHH